MKRFTIVGLAIGALALVGCDKSHQSSQVTNYDTHGAVISQMPGGFRNVAFKCELIAGEWFALAVTSDATSSSMASGVALYPDPSCARTNGNIR